MRHNKVLATTQERLVKNFVWTLFRGSNNPRVEVSSTRSNLHLWDDQVLVEFAAFWHTMLLHSICLSNVDPIPFLEQHSLIVQSTVLALHSITCGSPFPNLGDDIAVSENSRAQKYLLSKKAILMNGLNRQSTCEERSQNIALAPQALVLRQTCLSHCRS